ncbi:uncharacterized protein P884DRAFT_318199, partial [Thermothelomyces heterothallicus CBS 202.75]|uniref:uncharacterized protein n=1 Tax=Thermothelomyces heterothallicus CBS 202.75 TaxID=1149848 RepID=UPI003743ACF3
LQELPDGTQVHGITQSGASYWARTARIGATGSDGMPQYDQGKDMVSAEYFAMSLLHSVYPDMVVEPVAWGAYTGEPDTYFFLFRFHKFLEGEIKDGEEMKSIKKVPRVDELPGLVAEFHSRGRSGTGEFGFPITTYGGRNPPTFPLCKSWEECFSRGLVGIFDTEEQAQGPDDEMRQLREALMAKVIAPASAPPRDRG